jgi:hypothetical protein
MTKKNIKSQQLDKLSLELKQEEITNYSLYGLLIKTKEYIKSHIGENNEFYWAISTLEEGFEKEKLRSLIDALRQYIDDDLLIDLNAKEKAIQEISSDTLFQALSILDDSSSHPAASCFLAGATLENYLKNWAERESLIINNPPSIGKYAEALKKKGRITSQDLKDITSWAGLRNSAVHGDWSAVEDKRRVQLMVEGIGLFARKYSL